MNCECEMGSDKTPGTTGGGPGPELRCPVCCSHALHELGAPEGSKRRYVCVVCGRRFTLGTVEKDEELKPVCPECGSAMEPFRGYPKEARFRCSMYPLCGTYLKAPQGRDS